MVGTYPRSCTRYHGLRYLISGKPGMSRLIIWRRTFEGAKSSLYGLLSWHGRSDLVVLRVPHPVRPAFRNWQGSSPLWQVGVPGLSDMGRCSSRCASTVANSARPDTWSRGRPPSQHLFPIQQLHFCQPVSTRCLVANRPPSRGELEDERAGVSVVRVAPMVHDFPHLGGEHRTLWLRGLIRLCPDKQFTVDVSMR